MVVPRPRGPAREEAPIPSHRHPSRAYAEAYVPEDAALEAGRRRAEQVGLVPISPGAGALLAFLATCLRVRAAVEIGTGTGVSAVWLLRGMRPDGVLTTVDDDPEHQRLARETLREAGFAPNRVRMIPGPARRVLPRLADAGYDLVFCNAERDSYCDHLPELLRLLRPGGVVVFDSALWRDRVPDPNRRDEQTQAMRELGRLVLEDERLVPVLVPLGDGLLCAATRG